ncbi:MAG: hypothetical protein J6U26_02020, partial [Lachnospiraceae bacterium]|nr:hypothetical protein [Lachnospiraceae bacterium]
MYQAGGSGISDIRSVCHTFCPAHADPGFLLKRADHAADRFLRLSSLLPAGALMGLQAEGKGGGKAELFFFHGEGTGLSGADYDWALGGFCRLGEGHSAFLADLAAGGRTVYYLEHPRVPEQDGNHPGGEDPGRHPDMPWWLADDPESSVMAGWVDILELLAGTEAVIRVLPECGDAPSGRHAAVFLSFPGEIPLRVRAAIAGCFPGARLRHLGCPARGKGTGGTDDPYELALESVFGDEFDPCGPAPGHVFADAFDPYGPAPEDLFEDEFGPYGQAPVRV